MSSAFYVIIVAVDGSECSQRAARFAVDLAGATGGKVTLVYVFPQSSNDFDFISMVYSEGVNADQIRKETARKIFDQTYQALGGASHAFKEEILTGDPAQEIIHYLKERPQAMTVIGRRGLSGFEKLLLGSVSEKVVRYANGPVTIIR